MAEDEYGQYDTDAGGTEREEGLCNAPLRHWKSRYGEPRFCRRLPHKKFDDSVDHDYCNIHSGRVNIDMNAEELLQHGFFTETVDHHVHHLDPWRRVFVHGTFEVLMGDSRYEFAPEYETKTFDFTDSEIVPSQANEDDTLDVEVAYPTDHANRAIVLFIAAADELKMLDMQSRIMEVGDGAGMGEVSSTEYADFTSSTVPGEGGGEPKAWQTLEEVSEHHLNLPLSRLVKDHKELLKFGGVEVDGETTEDASAISLDLDNVGADPNKPNVDSEVQAIRDHTDD